MGGVCVGFDSPFCFLNKTSFYLYGCFQKIGIPPKWMVFIMENPIKMDDLGVPLFSETSTYNIYVYIYLTNNPFELNAKFKLW